MQSLAGKLVYQFTRGLVWVVGKLLFRMRVEGRGNIPRRGGVLIASNHVSHLDPPLIGTAVPRVVFHMAKRELFKVPLLHWYMRNIGTIMVHRGQGKQALLDAVERIGQGGAVIIFPEGTRSKTGTLMKGQAGAVIIAIRCGCPIVPAAIIGSEKAMTKGSKAIKAVPVTVRFGEPYTIAYSGSVEQIPKDVLERELAALMERIETLLPPHMHADPAEKSAWYTSAA